MKWTNRIVCILVLILAVATLVMTILLYQKREQLVKGWFKMDTAISTASATMDKGSETDYNKKYLNPKLLDHKHYFDLEKLLPKLQQQTKDIMEQRGTLSAALVKVGKAYELPNIPEPKVIDSIKAYKDNVSTLVATAENYAQINNTVLTRMASIGEKVGVSVQVAELRGNGAIENAEKITSGVGALRVKADTFAENFGAIAGVVGAEGDFNGAAYQSAVIDTVTKVKEMKARHDEYLTNWKNAQTQVAVLNAKVSQKDTEIKALSRKVTGLERQLAKFTQTPDADEDKINPNDPKLLKILKGRVIDINTKWDFVVINLGKESKVEQKFGDKRRLYPVNIPNDEEMVVVRGLDSDKPEFVGKVKLVQINDNCAIANIEKEYKTYDVRIGDAVFFSQDAINDIIKKRAAK